MINIRTSICFFALSTICILTISAQVKFDKRIEFELKNGFNKETIYVSKLGCFVMESTAQKDVKNLIEVKYDLFDSILIQSKTASVNIPSKMRFDEVFYNDQFIYNIYSNKHKFFITGVKVGDLSITETNGEMPDKTSFQNMKVLGTSAWFEARNKKGPSIYKVELESGKGKHIPVTVDKISPKKIEIVNYQLLEKSNELMVFSNVKVKKGVYRMNLMQIDEDGNIQKNIQLTDDNDNVISSASGHRMNDNKIVYTGTYSKNKQDLSEGLFFGESSNDKKTYINYYNFLDFKDFLSYLPERKQERIENKKKRKDAKNEEFSKDYIIVDHDIIELADGYLFLGEACYPIFRTQQMPMTTVVNGVTSIQYISVPVFDGYQYTHAVLAKFSKDGKLIWDNCFEMFPQNKPYYQKQFIEISNQTNNSIGMVFASGNYIVSKVVDFDGNVLSDKKSEIIDTNKESDKTRWATSNSDYWYNNHFLIYGTQKIKDKEEKDKRKVYFVNKISL